ncbi:hypothetical protein I317_05762 [Kwoniella heveanensis CBS 569]|nr:hypothetical protein I317_05762 [Kwoniella heveanensis CBS 569]
MMLPPLRMPHNTRMDVSYSPSTGSPAQPHYGFSSYPGTGGYQSRPQPYSYSGHVPQHSTSSSTGSEIWTPVSASGNGGYPFNSHQSFGAHPSHKQQPTTPSTIQPSVFPSWQSVSDSRTRVHQSTISPLGMLGSDSNRLDERRSSTPGQSGGDKWDRTAQSSVDVSPNTSDQLSSEDDVKAEAKDLNQVTYTTDAEVKQTAELKRMCFNCSNKSPPSWRKSLLHAGKILCNKCGIFERTHHRPRPPQNDDQKLRKQNQIIGATYRRDFPPNLQVMRDDSDGSQPGSPYSNVPSQATPMSATFPLSPFYPSPSDALMSSSALSHRRTNIHQQTSPSQHALATPVSSISAEMDPSSPLRTGYYAQRSSPYAQAYHNRRMYVQPVRMTSPVMPYSAGPLTGNGHGNGNGGPEQSPLQSSPMTGWNTGSRHNDAHIHSGLSTPSIGGHNDPMGSAATAGEETDEIDSASNGVKPEPS